MKLNNIHGFDSIDKYFKYKLGKYSAAEKSFDTLFEFMFDETDNVMAEFSDGYRITKITYGEFKDRILKITPTVKEALSDVPHGDMVGFYMSNCIEWIQIFWAILAAGYSPLIMNTRLSDEVLSQVVSDYSVKCVISDGKDFPTKMLKKEDVLIQSDAQYTPMPFGKEVIFMSSGTTDNVKLCAYTGENFYYQICDSSRIVAQCPKIKSHYEGELKHLVLLPLCHIFGFTAVYLWFGFFSRTFVFPNDLNPINIQRTVKKHKVTHIFAVPMVWEAIHKAAIKKIKDRGNSTLIHFNNLSNTINNFGGVGDIIARRLLSEVRDGIFGDSICFLISGGSHIKEETLRFFNGIGYHLVNGYGMTEIGITSVEKSSKRRIVNSGSIGAPLGYAEYMIDTNGELLVKGKSSASRIMQNGKSVETDYNKYFRTGDMMRFDKGRYYFNGRADDLIVNADGENINPIIVEKQIQIDGIDNLCLYNSAVGATLLVSVPGVFSDTALKAIYAELDSRITAIKLDSTIKKIFFTYEPLLRTGEFKISRRKISSRMKNGEIRAFDPRHIDDCVVDLLSGLEAEITECFAEALGKSPSQIKPDDDFFRDLGGTSLDYFALLESIKSRIGIDIVSSGEAKLSTVKAFADHIEQSSTNQ